MKITEHWWLTYKNINFWICFKIFFPNIVIVRMWEILENFVESRHLLFKSWEKKTHVMMSHLSDVLLFERIWRVSLSNQAFQHYIINANEYLCIRFFFCCLVEIDMILDTEKTPYRWLDNKKIHRCFKIGSFYIV